MCSHTLLDVLVHVPDIALFPGLEQPRLGTGLYGVPMAALAVETLFGIACWFWFGGSRALLAVIVLLNLAAISFYSDAIPGLEHAMGGRPGLFVGFMAFHITLGLVAIGWFARRDWRREPA